MISLIQIGSETILLSVRVAAVLLATPILYAFTLPGSVRVLLVLSLAVTISLGLSPSPSAATTLDWGAFIAYAAQEITLGLALAVGVLLAFGAVSFAGHLLDLQVGFSLSQLYDPASGGRSTVVAAVFNQLAVLLFFILGAHHALLRGVALSAKHFPPGSVWDLSSAPTLVLSQVGILFAIGFSLAAPVVVGLLMVELVMSVAARNLPQMNIFMMAIPVRIAVGLFLLALWSAGFFEGMTRAFESIYRFWDALLAPNASGAAHG
ncbi:MAG: flagellar biosynthetic protein FliR [Betaproteobacteria bacterium]|nr:flagellar biosynthetic protein FliR [Betaproteobacteria bacterium]